MNAAEITDKLGLHSLRQRAWVGSRWQWEEVGADEITVHPSYMCHLWRRSLRRSGVAQQLAAQSGPQLEEAQVDVRNGLEIDNNADSRKMHISSGFCV